MTKKIYLDTLKKCPGLVTFPLLRRNFFIYNPCVGMLRKVALLEISSHL